MTEFKVVPGYFGPKVEGKLGKMRKTRTWSVMPTSEEGRLIVQADGAIGTFDFRTGKGRLNTKGEYFPHLAVAAPFDFPPEFVRACLEACPSLDGETTRGGVTIAHTVEIIR